MPKTFSKPMFSADSLASQFRSALDLPASEFAMQTENATLRVGVDNGPTGLKALQKSALAVSVASLTMSAVKSSLLLDAQGHVHAKDALPANGSDSDVFRSGECLPAFQRFTSKGLHEGTSSLKHTSHCDVLTSTPGSTITDVFNTSFECGTGPDEQI